ncbi:MAG: hypothetical protein J5760_00755 [Clostridia bacterium]|nr:hypothetical protein [Clostridia bacterium]
MDGDLGEKLRQILGDKDAMEKISAIASGLGAPDAEKAPPPAQSEKTHIPPVKNDKAAFLTSLKPLLREEKRKKIDALQTALMLANVFAGYKNRKTE